VSGSPLLLQVTSTYTLFSLIVRPVDTRLLTGGDGFNPMSYYQYFLKGAELQLSANAHAREGGSARQALKILRWTTGSSVFVLCEGGVHESFPIFIHSFTFRCNYFIQFNSQLYLKIFNQVVITMIQASIGTI
jgi:hypothetical protein